MWREQKERESTRLRVQRFRNAKDKCDSNNDVTPPSSSSTSSSILNSPSESLSSACPHEKILELYHTTCTTLPRVQEFNKARQGYLKQRWRKNPNIEFWKNFWQRIDASDFLCGRKEGRDGPFMLISSGA